MTETEFLLQQRQAYWRELLTQTKGDVSRAARVAGKNRTSAHRLLKALGINASQYRPDYCEPRPYQRLKWPIHHL